MYQLKNLPPQKLPYTKKTKEWRKKHLDWADRKSFFNDNFVRKSVIHKMINYDLLRGNLHMGDLQMIINPDNVEAAYIPEKIQHYPIMNSKLEVLRGEEYKRRFDFRVVVTDPNSISFREDQKKEELFSVLQSIIADTSDNEQQFNEKVQEASDYYMHEWQDLREIRANALLRHYYKELECRDKFNDGIMDAMAVGEEIYQCEIVSGEPVINRLNPLKVRIFRNGYSNRVEDADMIVLEDFWSPGRIIDYFYDSLTEEDINYIEKIPFSPVEGDDDIQGIDERAGFMFLPDEGGEAFGQGIVPDSSVFFGEIPGRSSMYYDLAGNIRVLRVYWKSRRKVKMVTSFDENGDKVVTFQNEDYVISEELGETEKIFWINQAWGGTKIGKSIYVNMGPLPVQFFRMSNPSRCHFGIIGTLYNLNDHSPFSMVDIMKPFNYLYDAVYDRLVKAISSYWGTLYDLDMAQVPEDWDIDKWLYFAKVSHIAVKNSFNEGSKGAATGKIAGNYANNSRGMMSAGDGNYIQQLINILEYIPVKMSELIGISRQREGQIDNRETVGGVERSTLQSSHITEWLFIKHNSLKRRVLECLLELAKACARGRTLKFPYLLSDNSLAMCEIDGDEFAESDYGLVVDTDSEVLAQKLDALATNALQHNRLDFSTIMKIYTSQSLADTQRMIERNEKEVRDREMQAQREANEVRMSEIENESRMREAELAQKQEANIRDNETKILIAGMSSNEQASPGPGSDELLEKIRQFNEKMKLDREKLALDKTKHDDDIALRKKELSYKNTKK